MKTFTKTNITHKILSVVLNLLLIFYSVAPGVSASLVYAEEATPAATVEEISAEEPQVSPSPSPVVEPTISPEPFPLPSILPEASPEITPSASSSAEPSSTDQIENNTSPEPTVGQPNAPPEESPGPSLSPEPSPSVTVEQPIQGHLSATILENTDASSLQLDLSIQGEVSSASLTTDKADYAPTDTAVITGSDFPKEAELKLIITADNYRFEDKVTTDGNGQFIYTYQLDGVYRPLYNVEAQNLSGQILATTSFTDSQNSNPSADLDQCANDPAPSPSTDGCSASASDWVNGNLGSSKSSYFENDSIPYRMRLENLSLASHTVTIEWDTTKGGKHAIDYLTTFNRTVATANPCLGVSGCSTSSTFSIPVDPQVSGAGVTPVAGNFTLYGGTITAVSAYSYSNGTGFTGDKSARITITFTASVANPVLAWGGHIADRDDWGDDMAAVAIPGSPYHTRLIDLDGSGGNQDRSLSADAVVFPGSITIIKQATPEGSTLFPFTASPSPLSAFSLVDDGTSVNTKAFTDITDFQTYSVNETPLPSGWAFDAINCSVISPNGGSQTPSGSTVSINLKEGENVTCTYTNHQLAGTLLVKKHVVNDNAGTAAASDFTLHVKSGGTDVASSPAAGSESGTSYSLNAGTYNVSEDTPLSGYSNVTTDLNNGDCDGSGNVTVVAGQTKTCTITNDDVVSALHLRKTVTNDNGGTAVNTAWTLTATGTGGSPTNLSGTTPVDSGSDFKADTYALAEINGPAGYAAGAWDCGAATMPDATHVTVPLGGNVTCTINNDDIQPKLTVTKIVTNDNGGTKQVSDFPLFVDQTSVTSGQQNGFNAATYIVSEIQDAGYDATIDGDCAANGSIILNVGDVKSCTITNNDKIAHLTLVKEVINDNNGNATANDWTLSATGPGALQVIAVSGSGSADGDVNAGTYTLSESGPSGYDASAWDCQGGSQNGNQITLNLGESATCNITNDDNAPSLTLLKTVTNDNGGTA